MSVQMPSLSVSRPPVVDAKISYRPSKVVNLSDRFQRVIQTQSTPHNVFGSQRNFEKLYADLFSCVSRMDLIERLNVQYQAILPPIYEYFMKMQKL